MTESTHVDWKGSDRFWPLIADAYARFESADSRWDAWDSVSARRTDDGQPAGHRPYIAAHRLLTVGHENYKAFHDLVHNCGFGPNAPFNLLRPVLENSLWALWLLDPATSQERRLRGLNFEIQDHKAAMAYYDELCRLPGGGKHRAAVAEQNARVSASYRSDAKALGVEYRTASQKANLTDLVPKIEWIRRLHDSDYPRLLVAEWRRLSGYQHSKAWSSMLGSDRTVVTQVTGGQRAIHVASDDGISMALTFTSSALLDAFELYIERCTNPARP